MGRKQRIFPAVRSRGDARTPDSSGGISWMFRQVTCCLHNATGKQEAFVVSARFNFKNLGGTMKD